MFLPDYRLDLSVRSLLGSRSRLQDVPKIARLIESRVHNFLLQRCVEPRFQQIILPSLWPRKQNTRGGESADDSEASADRTPDESGAIGVGEQRPGFEGGKSTGLDEGDKYLAQSRAGLWQRMQERPGSRDYTMPGSMP